MALRVRSACLLAAALAWAAWVAVHYFTLPIDRLLLTAGPSHPVPFWRDALVRSMHATIGAGGVVLSAWVVGVFVTDFLRLPSNGRIEGALFRIAFGLAALAYGFLALAYLHLYEPSIVRAILLGGAIAAAVVISMRRGTTIRPAIPPLTWVERLYIVCIIGACAFAVVGAFAPESEYDALWYHLWLPSKWLEARGPVDIVEEYVSLYPLTWELLYGAAMAAGGPIAGKLMHFICLPLVGVASWLLATRLFPRASAVLAAALAMTTPIVLWEATTAYIDLALTLYVSLAIYSLVRHDDTRDRRWLIAAAVMMGVALAIKHLALVALAVAGGMLFVRESFVRRSIGRGLITAAGFALIALAIPAPWYVRAFAASGNPVFPDLYALFGATPVDRWSAGSERGLDQFRAHFGTARSALNMIRLPWDLTVHSASFGGTLGPAFLILAPVALLRRRIPPAAAVSALFCIAYIAMWASPVSSLQMRFLIPLVPVLAALAAEGAGRLRDAAETTVAGSGRLAAAGLIVLLVFDMPPFIGWHEPDRVGWNGWLTHVIRGIPAGVVIGAESDESYLARVVPSYRAWRFIDANVPPASRILTFSGGDQLYGTRMRLWSDASAARAITWDTPPGEESTALAAARRFGITDVLMDKRLIESGSADTLAIASDRMRACCLSKEYEDDRFVLYRLNDSAGAERVLLAPDRARP